MPCSKKARKKLSLKHRNAWNRSWLGRQKYRAYKAKKMRAAEKARKKRDPYGFGSKWFKK